MADRLGLGTCICSNDATDLLRSAVDGTWVSLRRPERETSARSLTQCGSNQSVGGSFTATSASTMASSRVASTRRRVAARSAYRTPGERLILQGRPRPGHWEPLLDARPTRNGLPVEAVHVQLISVDLDGTPNQIVQVVAAGADQPADERVTMACCRAN
jgi:hypothetical protein